MRAILIALLGLLVFAASAPAKIPPKSVCPSYQDFRVVEEMPVLTPIQRIALDEIAIEKQSRQLAAEYGTPCARFGSTGWKVVFRKPVEYPGALGYHTVGDDGNPRIVVGPWDGWRITFSHEILETLADPSTTGNEVCDPVEDHFYHIDGLRVSDWVLPSYWQHPHPAGPLDFMHTRYAKAQS